MESIDGQPATDVAMGFYFVCPWLYRAVHCSPWAGGEGDSLLLYVLFGVKQSSQFEFAVGREASLLYVNCGHLSQNAFRWLQGIQMALHIGCTPSIHKEMGDLVNDWHLGLEQ